MSGNFHFVTKTGQRKKWNSTFSHLQVLDFLDQLDILLREASLVRCDIDDGAVQFLDLDAQLVDGDFELFGVLDADQTLLGYVLDLCKKLINFGLEFGLFLIGPEMIVGSICWNSFFMYVCIKYIFFRYFIFGAYFRSLGSCVVFFKYFF